MLILSQNQTSIYEEDFACGRFSCQICFVYEKHVRRGPRYKKSRYPWDGVYLRTRITLRALPSDWQSCGKPSSKFPHGGLVECLFFILHISYLTFQLVLENFKFSKKSRFFLELTSFLKFSKKWYMIGLVVTLFFIRFIASIFIFNIRSTTFSVGFHEGHQAKPW